MGTAMGRTERNAELNGMQAKEDSSALMPEVVAGIRVMVSRHLQEQIQRLCSVLDDQLFNLSGQARDASLESEYFLAMRLIRRESSALKGRYDMAVLRRYDEFWNRRLREQDRSNDSIEVGTGFGNSELALVAEDVLEEDLAISGMAEKGKILFQRDLYALDKRFAHMAGREEIEPDDNPLGPQSLCRAFAGALKPLPLDLSLKLLIYKLYEQVVLRALGGFYGEVEGYLVREGILPGSFGFHKRKSLSREVAAKTPVGSIPSVPAGTPRADDLAESQKAYLEVFESMQGLLDSWRIRVGLPAANPIDFSGPVVAVAEVLGVLSKLQQPSVVYVARGAENLKHYVHGRLGGLRPGEASRPLGRREEDVIDMVSMVFDFILDDPNLPDAVKGLIARLQIPVVKVAILEPTFFGRKNHPARLLLNALAQAGIGLDMEEGGRDSPVFRYIESIVNRVSDEFDQDVKLFGDLLDEFTAFTEKEAQRSRLAEERTLQATHSKERLRLCKRKVAYEITHRLEGKKAPAAVRSFLFNIWKDVMVLAYLRRDRSPADWERSLDVMDLLIWTVTVPTEPNTVQKLVEAIPTVMTSIRAGLEGISLEPMAVAEALRDLQACHNARLSHPALEEAVLTAQQKVEIRDPDLARAIVEIRDHLPDVGDFALADLVEPRGSVNSVPDECLAKAHALESGQWVEFSENDKRIRAKLSWKSQTTTTHVFVNRKGTKVLEISLAELAGRFAANSVRVVEGGATPLMDRALQALMNTLRGPMEESAAPSVG